MLDWTSIEAKYLKFLLQSLISFSCILLSKLMGLNFQSLVSLKSILKILVNTNLNLPLLLDLCLIN
jgi:hypothetical protein